jgi:signal transduction histidine kinase
VDLDLSAEEIRRPPETELVLFRIVQQALTNISRHSKSPKREFVLRISGAIRYLMIEDDGRGMPVGGAQTWPKQQILTRAVSALGAYANV